MPPLKKDAAGLAQENLARLRDGTKGPPAEEIRSALRHIMMMNVGIYRREGDMAEAVEKAMKIWLEIRRFNPETDKKPHFQKFEVEAEPSDRLLDTLMKVKRVQDPSLDYPDGIWPCENLFECTRVCPCNIKVTKLINLTKRRVKEYRKGRGEDIHDKTD